MILYLTEKGKIKKYVYNKPNVRPDDILEDLRHHAFGVGMVVRDFHMVFSDGRMRFKRPIYCTATIS